MVQGRVLLFRLLGHVPSGLDPTASESKFSRSPWWRRGWTLQELLAPHMVIFCDGDWNPLGVVGRNTGGVKLSRLPNVAEIVSTTSRIAIGHLSGKARWTKLSDVSVAERMIWAAERKTTRPEDEAYCLLGIFGVNMPMLYGEGQRAFRRLQQELIRATNDQSIFAWMLPLAGLTSQPTLPMFAAFPSLFADSGHVRAGMPCVPYELTNRGLKLVAEYVEVPWVDSNTQVLIAFNCHVRENVPHRTRKDDASSALPSVWPRKVFPTLKRHGGSNQWTRYVVDDLAFATQGNDCMVRMKR